jgi:hypothetical protein
MEIPVRHGKRLADQKETKFGTQKETVRPAAGIHVNSQSEGRWQSLMHFCTQRNGKTVDRTAEGSLNYNQRGKRKELEDKGRADWGMCGH